MGEKKVRLFFIFSIFFFSMSNISASVDGQIGINLIPETPINYTSFNVNNSQFLQGYTPATLPLSTAVINLNNTLASWVSALFIPYNGANQNINLGNNNLTINQTTFFVNTNNGYVGIGTTNPAYPLHVNRSSGSSYAMKIQNTAGTGSSWGLKIEAGSNGSDAAFAIANSANNIEFFRVLGNGNIGIGTTNPQSRLYFPSTTNYTGGILFATDGFSSDGFSIWGNTAGSTDAYIESRYNSNTSRIHFRTKASTANPIEAMTILGNGSIGIGTTNPTQLLDVNGSINISGSSGILYTPQICLNGNCQTSWGGVVAGTGQWSNTSSQIYIAAGYPSTLNISNNLFVNGSSVGIGTSSPSGKLSIAGAPTDNAYFFYDNADVGDTTDGQSVYVYRMAAEGDVFLRTYVNQYKSATMSSNSNLRFTTVDNSGGYMFFDSNDDIYLDIGNNKDLLVRNDSDATLFNIDEATGKVIVNTGNVGIGTTTPQQKLNVVGNGNFTGNLTYNGYYGGMWMHNDSGTAIITNSTYQKLTFLNADNLNGFSFTGGNTLYLTGVGGMYTVKYKLEGTGTQNHEYHSFVYVNELQQNNTIGHAIGQASASVDIDGIGFVRINTYDNVTIRLADLTADGTGGYIDGNINLVRIGN